ncbi:alkane hydroxylase MAH1-like [Papaver somniferum]|uniref:alkane hydroxylase MAH1-like n=1 Tax=Papaver somniferum TaxID=3469 RepID=UPI000E6F851E|nr:alkane hydroxylase MAH1-like [Papaver somniferum]
MHRIHDWTVDVVNLWGSTIVERRAFFGCFSGLVTCDPENIEYILKTKFSNFPKGDDFKETLDIFGDSLIMDSLVWNNHRRMTRRVLMSNPSRNVIADTSKKVVQDSLIPFLSHVVNKSLIIDLQDVFLRYTFDTSFSVLFGRSANYLSTSLLPNELAQGLDDAMEALFYRNVLPNACWKLCRLLMIGSERKMDEVWKTTDRYLATYIKAKREDMIKGIAETSSVFEGDMSNLIQNENDEALILDDKLFRDSALSFFIGGNDTTGTALTWFFWLVAKNPNVETKILEELKLIIFSKKNLTEEDDSLKMPLVFAIDDLKDAVYLHATICESLRLYPPIPHNRRTALKKDVLPDGTIVDPGIMIVISMYAAGRMEHVWGKDCLEFKPERWISENGKLNHETMSKFFGFSIGPRSCIGQEMAFVMMKLAASAMIFNFQVEVLVGQLVEPKPSIVLKMKNGLMVRVKERVLHV